MCASLASIRRRRVQRRWNVRHGCKHKPADVRAQQATQAMSRHLVLAEIQCVVVWTETETCAPSRCVWLRSRTGQSRLLDSTMRIHEAQHLSCMRSRELRGQQLATMSLSQQCAAAAAAQALSTPVQGSSSTSFELPLQDTSSRGRSWCLQRPTAAAKPRDTRATYAHLFLRHSQYAPGSTSIVFTHRAQHSVPVLPPGV